MFGAGEHQMLVDLVGHHQNIVLLGDLGDELQFVAGEHLAGRVVRRVEQDQFGAVGDRRTELVAVEAVAPVALVIGSQQHRLQHAAGEGDAGLVAVVHRLEQNDLVATVEHPEQCPSEGLGCAGGDEHLRVGVVVEPVEALLMLRDRLPQHGHTRAGWILIDAGPDRLDGGVEDLDRTIGIGETLTQVDRTGLHGQRRHLGEDGGAESGQLRRQRMIGSGHVEQRRRRTGASGSSTTLDAGCTPDSTANSLLI